MIFLKAFKLKDNEYLKTMKPMLYLMKIICALPFQLKAQHDIPYFISSKVISCVTIVICIIFHINFGGYILDILFEITNIKILVGRGPEILFELFCLAVPIVMLNRNKEIQDYWNAWKQFQMQFEAISGEPYISKKRRYVKIAALICISWLILRSVYSAWFHYHIYSGVLNFTVNAYVFFLVYAVSTYWFTNCSYFQSMSEDILILGKKIIEGKKDNYKLNKLISVWLNLTDLMNHFNETHSFLFLSFFLLVVISIVTYAYTILNFSTFRVIYPFTVFINLLTVNIIFLLLICETAHSVHHQINYRQKEALLLENTMKVNTAMLKLISRFLHTICLRNPTINLNGFFALNRVEFPMIFALCINYLIILRQFSEHER